MACRFPKFSTVTGLAPRKVGSPLTSGHVGGQLLPASSVSPEAADGLAASKAEKSWHPPSVVVVAPEKRTPKELSDALISRGKPSVGALRDTAQPPPRAFVSSGTCWMKRTHSSRGAAYIGETSKNWFPPTFGSAQSAHPNSQTCE